VFQVALQKPHDTDADSAMGISIVTDDKNSCRFSNDEEVCVCAYHNATIVVNNCTKTDNICVLESKWQV